jgi:hypothetical protein
VKAIEVSASADGGEKVSADGGKKVAAEDGGEKVTAEDGGETQVLAVRVLAFLGGGVERASTGKQ